MAGITSTVNMKSQFYGCQIPPPFEKVDLRLKKVSMDIRLPSLKELRHVHWLLSRGELRQFTERDEGNR